MRNMKDSILEEPLIHLRIWIRNDAVVNEEDDESEVSIRSLPMKQIKVTIVQKRNLKLPESKTPWQKKNL